MLNEHTGVIDEIDGTLFITGALGTTGHLIYGPYAELAPGTYRVFFEVSAVELGDFHEDFICAVADVTANYGQADVAFVPIMYSDVVSGLPIIIDFDILEHTSNCEYRIWTNGIISLRVSDLAEAKHRFGPPKFGLQRPRGDPSAALIKRVWEAGIRITVDCGSISVPIDQFNLFKNQILDLFKDDLFRSDDRRRLASMVVEGVGYRGCGENSLFRAFVGTDQPMVADPGRIPFTSSLCHQTHFGYEQYRFWMKALKEEPKYQRKQWEFVFIAQALFERGYLKPGKKGIVFGAGEEQLPALFASFGVEVLATDQSSEAASASGWASTKEFTYDLGALNQRGICTDRMFSDLVSFKPVDMNAIPTELNGQFDFCWSACALEHLGSLDHGITFIKKSMDTLRPGGIAVHTTEFNLSSNDDTIETAGLSIYRRRDIENLTDWLIERGYLVAPIDWDLLGEGFAETVIDLAPFLARGEPHIRLLIGKYNCTSIGIIIEKPMDWPVS